jgi:hypothetical protein
MVKSILWMPTTLEALPEVSNLFIVKLDLPNTYLITGSSGTDNGK